MARPRPGEPVGALIDRFQPAGNKALATLLHPAVQRQDEDAGDGADAPAAPLLDNTQVADARRFYTSQPWLYTPAIVTQLRTTLELAPDGGIDDALVLAVAKWQTENGTDDPALKVDGKAGPRTLPRMFRSGLNVEGQAEAFGGEVQTGVIDEWASFDTPEARRDTLVTLINTRLANIGVPEVKPAWDANENNAGSFNFPTWEMRIGKKRLGGDSISLADGKDIADTVYHEARHTEQWFRMAQLRAAQGLSAGGIATELGIEVRIARLAKDAPLVRGSMEAVIAQGWWDSVYGAGSDHRDATLTEIDRASTARRQAQKRFDDNPTPANQAALDRAKARFDRAFAGYQNLPEENDAWATGTAAQPGVTSGSPAPEPAPAEDEAEGADAAGSPPTSDGPAHGTFPEENLPAGVLA